METTNNITPIEKALVSDRKREANRQNAQKSTGPKTDAGKLNSSRNAVKHGLWSNRDPQLYGENNEKFLQTHAALRAHYQPVGPLEEFEVERIAHMQRRMGRGWQFENAAISLEQRKVIHYQEMVEEQVHEAIRRAQEIFAKYPNIMTEPNEAMESEIERNEKSKEHDRDAEQVSEAEKYRSEHAEEHEPDAKPRSEAEKYHSFLYQDYSMQIKLSELEKSSLPKPEDLNTLLRAEAAADKGIARSIKRLEDLQTKRKEKENTYRLETYNDPDEIVTV